MCFQKIHMPYIIQIEEDLFELENANQIDAAPISEKAFHVLDGSQSYHVEIVETDFVAKKMTLEVNGNKYDIAIKDTYDQLVKEMGLAIGNTQKLKNIKAPMPGLIIDILVEPGQTVEKGDALLILEAMKMENVLKAEGEGVVKSIEIGKGTAVDKGQVIIEME